MKIDVTGDTSHGIKITLTHDDGQSLEGTLARVAGVWTLKGVGVSSVEGFRIAHPRTHWPSALQQAIAFMRRQLTAAATANRKS